MADEQEQAKTEQEQEKTYEVKDKRRFNEDGTAREDSEAAAAGEQAEPEAGPESQTEAEQAAQAERASAGEPAVGGADENAEPPTVYDLLQFVMTMVADQAWLHMGLRVAPGQKEPRKDMAQAKIAIDTVVFITDKLHPHLDDESRRALRALVSDLQLNFVRHS